MRVRVCVYGVCGVCVCVNVYVRELTCLRDVVSLYFSRYILGLISEFFREYNYVVSFSLSEKLYMQTRLSS